MQYGIVPKGYYTSNGYMGWTGEKDRIIHRDIYQLFDTESEYIDWWQDRFSGKENKDD